MKDFTKSWPFAVGVLGVFFGPLAFGACKGYGNGQGWEYGAFMGFLGVGGNVGMV